MIREYSASEVSVDNSKLMSLLEEFKISINNSAFDIPVAVRRYSKLIGAKLAKVLVKEDDDRLLGVIAFIISHQVHTKEKCAIESFWYAVPGLGVEEELVTAFENTAKNSGCERVTLHISNIYHTQLGDAYERNGYSLAELNYSKEI